MGKNQAQMSLFTDDLKLDGDDIIISRGNRLDKRRKQNDKSCDIMADRQNVLHSAKHLKGKNPPVYRREKLFFMLIV